jgi:hypothetical protein
LSFLPDVVVAPVVVAVEVDVELEVVELPAPVVGRTSPWRRWAGHALRLTRIFT